MESPNGYVTRTTETFKFRRVLLTAGGSEFKPSHDDTSVFLKNEKPNLKTLFLATAEEKQLTYDRCWFVTLAGLGAGLRDETRSFVVGCY
jgi:hypothetical protein